MNAREFFDLVAEWVDANRRYQRNKLFVDQFTAVDRRNRICREVDRVRAILKKQENKE